jgi:hypothetical protein
MLSEEQTLTRRKDFKVENGEDTGLQRKAAMNRYAVKSCAEILGIGCLKTLRFLEIRWWFGNIECSASGSYYHVSIRSC